MTEATLPSHRIHAIAHGGTVTGPVRLTNQDALVVAGASSAVNGIRLSWQGEVPPSGVAFAVVDGMGGHAGGEEAAALVASSLAHATAAEPDWGRWFTELSRRVELAGSAWGMPDAGATAALLALTPDGVRIANVGDCRVYQAVGGRLGQLTVDDRTDDPASNVVTQAIGGQRILDAHAWDQEYRGDAERYLLCSDGIWGTLDAALLRELVTSATTGAEVVEQVLAAAEAQPARDNCTVIVVDVTPTPQEMPWTPSERAAPVHIVHEPTKGGAAT